MPKLPSEKFLRYLLAFLLVIMLGACVGSRAEPFAPELGKSYVSTEELVLTSLEVVLPGLFRDPQEVPYIVTPSYYILLGRINFIPEPPLPKLGEIVRGSRVQVEQMFIHSDLNGRVRHSKVQFTDPMTGERFTAYATWDDIRPTLKEIR